MSLNHNVIPSKSKLENFSIINDQSFEFQYIQRWSILCQD